MDICVRFNQSRYCCQRCLAVVVPCCKVQELSTVLAVLCPHVGAELRSLLPPLQDPCSESCHVQCCAAIAVLLSNLGTSIQSSVECCQATVLARNDHGCEE